MAKSVRYMIDTPLAPSPIAVLYRRTEGEKTLKFDEWNSNTKKWTPSSSACDAFCGEYVLADPIDESEALEIIEQAS